MNTLGILVDSTMQFYQSLAAREALIRWVGDRFLFVTERFRAIIAAIKMLGKLFDVRVAEMKVIAQG